MRAGNRRYTSGANALNYTQEYTQPRLAQNAVTRKVRKLKSGKLFRFIKDEKSNVSFLTIFSIVYIFIGITLIIFSNASLVATQRTVASLQKELKTLEEQNAGLKAEISENFNIMEIENKAILVLGMNKPKPHQEEHISVPKQSYVIRKNTRQKEDSLSFVDNILSFFNLLHKR